MKKHFCLLIAFVFLSTVFAQNNEALARAYMAARSAYDIDQTKVLLTDDARIIELGDPMSVEDVDSFLDYAEAAAFHWDVGTCSASDDANYELSCAFLTSNRMTQALEIDPVAGGMVSFVFENEKISAVNLDFPLDWWQPNVWRMFMGFVRANHVDDFDLMFTDRGLIGISEEGLALWESHTNEFVEVMAAARANTTVTPSEQVGFDFLEARGNWDAEAIFSLMADDFESYDLQRASSFDDYQDAMAYYEALNWNWIAKTCDDIGQSGEVNKVMCVAELSNDLTQGLNNGSYNMGWGLEIQDEQIIGIYPEWNNSFVDNNLMVFRAYLVKNHPADLAKIYSEASQFLPRGEETLVLLKTRVVEFLADQP